MNTFLLIAQIIVSIAIIASVLLQSQGTGLGAVWGGGGESYHTKRGVEKILLYFTVVCIVLFAVLSIANLTVA